MVGLDRELTPRRLHGSGVVLAVAISRPRPAWPDQHGAGSRHDTDRDQEPGAHFPSVTVCLETFQVPPERTKVEVTPSFSGEVTGGTGLPVAL